MSFGGRHVLHNGFQHVGNTLPGFCADQKGVGSIQADSPFDHFFGSGNVGALQVDLVDNRNDLQSVVDCQIGIGERLGFDALRRIYHQQGALT